MTGIKNDNGKPRPDLIFTAMARALMEVAAVAAFGAEKYDDDNWLLVDNKEKRYRDAKGRHMLMGAFEENDAESGLSHLAHEAWNMLAVLELRLREIERGRQVTTTEQREVVVWVEHNGVGRPLHGDSLVDVKLLNGSVLSRRTVNSLDWDVSHPAIVPITHWREARHGPATHDWESGEKRMDNIGTNGNDGIHYGETGFNISGAMAIEPKKTGKPSMKTRRPQLDSKYDWQVWVGGEQPVEGGVLVDIELKGGGKLVNRYAAAYEWLHAGNSSDIIKWRLSTAE